jgi:hypothetical protein
MRTCSPRRCFTIDRTENSGIQIAVLKYVGNLVHADMRELQIIQVSIIIRNFKMWYLYSFAYTNGHSIFCTKAPVIISNCAYNYFTKLFCSPHGSRSTVWIDAADTFKYLSDYTVSPEELFYLEGEGSRFLEIVGTLHAS